MTTLLELIQKNKQRPIRRVYIKRRYLSDGSFETNWLRIDNYDNRDRIIDYGVNDIEINNDPSQLNAFNVSGTTMIVDNQTGIFNVETSDTSIWYPDTTYLNRKFTKIKIEVGLYDKDDNEVGVQTIFEGYINKVSIREDGTASLNILSYQAILQKYDISDLSLTGNQTVSAIVTSIMNQSKITNYIPYVAPSPNINSTIDSTLLTGTYWDVLKRLAVLSNSATYVNGSTFYFKARVAGSIVYNFQGAGTQGGDDIFNIPFYDDEGADSVRLYWLDTDSGQIVQSTNPTLLKKYLGEPQRIDLNEITTGAGQLALLNSFLSQWENPKPVIEIVTRYMVNIVNPLDKITIKTFGAVWPGNTFIWDQWIWNDGSVWGRSLGGINISSGTEWMVTRVRKDTQNWRFIIKAEKV